MSIISTYLGPVHSAILAFPLLALVLTFPYLIYEYRHYGAIPLLRTILVYTFILYLINAYFQVILPLPSRAEVAASAAPAMQMTPGHFLRMIRRTADWHIHSLHGLKEFLKNPYVYQAILNTILLFPLGIYLHYYFRVNFFLAVPLMFLVSLFFEMTQRTGLYGLYAHAYRTFDVDDLILNTAGGTVGWLLAPLICFPLPSRDKIDASAYRRGDSIPIFRRFLAFFVDFFVISVIQWVISLIIPATAVGFVMEVLLSVVFTIIYFTVFPLMTDGYTLGKSLFRLRLTNRRGKHSLSPLPQQYLVRAAWISILIAHLPHYWVLCQEMKQITYNNAFTFWDRFQTITEIGMAVFVIEIIVRMITQDKQFFYEKFSSVQNENMIQHNKKEDGT